MPTHSRSTDECLEPSFAGPRPEVTPIRHILLATQTGYLGDSEEAGIAVRTLAEALARYGYTIEAVCRAGLDLDPGVDPAEGLARRGLAFEEAGNAVPAGDVPRPAAEIPAHLRLTVQGVSITLLRRPTATQPEAAEDKRREFLRLLDIVLDRVRPDVLVAHGTDRLARDVLARAHARGAATLLVLHDFPHRHPAAFADVDAALVFSEFAADFCRETLGLGCTVLPLPVDPAAVRAEPAGPGYVTFVDPTSEHGVWAFARIADELGRRRPDIPLLVVEGRGTEATLAACGLDLRTHGSVHLMDRTDDPREVWGATRIALLPELGWEGPPLAAVAALINGLPVVASDRGSLPETLGAAGVVLPLPQRLTAATRWLPTSEEVAPWVEAVIRLWDDDALHDEHRRRACEEARRWAPEVLGPRYVALIDELRTRPQPPAATPQRRAKAVVLVPHLNGIEWGCEQQLRLLERAGVRVVRREGSSAIDVARNALASDALHDGCEALLFIDADVGFDPLDALRLLARPEPVVAGVYAKKGRRAFASAFAEGLAEVRFGPDATGLYPLKYAATGFLRIRAEVLRRLVAELGLPLCNTAWGRGLWPFFQPTIVPQPGDRFHYLGEDWSFSHRLGQIGVTPLADTSIRLWHFGRYGYGWEDVGSDPRRHHSFHIRLGAGGGSSSRPAS